MVLTREELSRSLQHEIKILLHLASKLEPAMLDYRPTPKQRSALELLRYLSAMAPGLLEVAETGTFSPPAWTVHEKAAAGRDFAQTLAVIAAQGVEFGQLEARWSDADMRAEIAVWGETVSRGSFLVNFVLCGYAAYRTQLFLYLKACGRDELGTINLWDGADPAN
jgi:hypothetical protein